VFWFSGSGSFNLLTLDANFARIMDELGLIVLYLN